VVATLPRVVAAPTRVAAPRNLPTDIQPIAHRTRSPRANADSITASAHAALRVTFALPADHIDKSTLSQDTQYNLSPQWNTVPIQRRIESTFQLPQNKMTPPTTTNRFALLADAIDDDELPTDTITDEDESLPLFIACPVLDHETGQTLKHGQLRTPTASQIQSHLGRILRRRDLPTLPGWWQASHKTKSTTNHRHQHYAAYHVPRHPP